MKKYIIPLLLTFSITTLATAQNKLAKGEHFANINGIKIHYYVAGKGPVCLFPTPGWGPSIEGYRKTLQPLEKYFTMIWYDTRMSGKSTGPTDSTKYTSNDFMEDMDALRVYLKQKKVWIAGHSAGGFQVLNYGINHSEKLHGIIAIDAIAGNDSLRGKESEKIAMKRKGKPYFDAADKIDKGIDTTKYSTLELTKILLPFYFHDENNLPKFLAVAGQLSEKAGKYTTTSHFSTEYLFPLLTKIKVPTLVIVGDDDFICDKVSQADRITKKIQNAAEVVIKDAGHFPWIEQPTSFFGETEKWLQKQKLKVSK